MNSLELTSAITALANAIALNLDESEITLLASILVQLSDTLNTIVATRGLCERSASFSTDKKTLF